VIAHEYPGPLTKMLARATVLKDFAGGRQAFSQAAFKWVLSNPHVSGLVVSIQDFEQIDEYLFASGKPFSDADLALLADYDQRIAHEYCRPGCGQCLEHCPNDVPVDDVLRYGMYAEGLRLGVQAREQYAALPVDRNAALCGVAPRRARSRLSVRHRDSRRSSCVSTACSP
jgi:predicted aldo/keto reductase-like oxidoreductase